LIPTTTSVTDNGPNPSSSGQAVSFLVSVSGNPTNGESVNLEDASNGNAVVGTGTLTGGSVTITVSTLPAGVHNIFAVYAGDTTLAGSQSTQVAQTVNAGSVTALSGTPQSTTVTTAFGSALVAIVRDSNNNPIAGVTVTFTAPSSGSSGTFSNS